MKWTEGSIIRAISRQTLNRKCTVLVDNCSWTGHECDVLAVTDDLRIIDVEVKISRSDLKADAKKDKWWHRDSWRFGQPEPAPVARVWPPKVWKHYYAMPAEIWGEALFEFLPSPASGVLVLRGGDDKPIRVECVRRATPNKDATRLVAPQVMQIARLANLRMWEAYERAEQRAMVEA